MRQVSDLNFVGFDVLFAKGDRVAIRYTAEGTHKGGPHGDLPPTGRKACWTATALLRAENGRAASDRDGCFMRAALFPPGEILAEVQPCTTTWLGRSLRT